MKPIELVVVRVIRHKKGRYANITDLQKLALRWQANGRDAEFIVASILGEPLEIILSNRLQVKPEEE